MHSLLTLVFTFVMSSAVLSASSIQFVQSGWSTGAELNVTFSGQDADNDGAITLPELSTFRATWGVPNNETVWTLADIEPDGFLFADLDNHLFFTRNAEFSLVSTAFEGEVLSSVFDEFLFPVDSSTTPPAVVPEPAGLSVAGLALLVAGYFTRKRMRTQKASFSPN